jgi:hypothetical protein
LPQLQLPVGPPLVLQAPPAQLHGQPLWHGLQAPQLLTEPARCPQPQLQPATGGS